MIKMPEINSEPLTWVIYTKKNIKPEYYGQEILLLAERNRKIVPILRSAYNYQYDFIRLIQEGFQGYSYQGLNLEIALNILAMADEKIKKKTEFGDLVQLVNETLLSHKADLK